jgi:hypothetical protein
VIRRVWGTESGLQSATITVGLGRTLGMVEQGDFILSMQRFQPSVTVTDSTGLKLLL